MAPWHPSGNLTNNKSYAVSFLQLSRNDFLKLYTDCMKYILIRIYERQSILNYLSILYLKLYYTKVKILIMINKLNCNKDVLFMLSKPRSQVNIETTEKID